MRTIHKYTLSEPVNEVQTCEGVRFLHVENQHEQITVWAQVNTLERECMRRLYLVGTGHELPSGANEYLGSALMTGLITPGEFVFHVYAEGRCPGCGYVEERTLGQAEPIWVRTTPCPAHQEA